MAATADTPQPPSDAPPAAATAEERHASWIELFFDLVVVAGIGMLAHLLHDAGSLTDLFLYVVLYLAFWTAWANVAMYGNVAGERAHTTGMLAAMALLAVMVTAVPEVRDEHAAAFALAYVGLRVLADQMWHRGQVVVDWPLLQLGFGTVPWIVSVFVDAPWRYVLWGTGVAIDLVVLFAVSAARMLDSAEARMEHARQAAPERSAGMEIDALHSDPAHLAERLGLYVIIVLGEGLIQVLDAASEAQWDASLAGVSAGAFALLVAVWTLSVRYGYASVPHLAPTRLPVRIAMALHCFSTGALAVLATGLGLAATDAHGQLPAHVRWLLCGSVSFYFAVVSLAAALLVGVRWLLSSALQCTLAPLVIGAFGGSLGAVALVWLLVAVAYWQVLWLLRPGWHRSRRGGHPSGGATASGAKRS
ncbi:low temperature requirement protein A [Streptomyces sp. NPDC050400]|uniref:low temperature requirement protein A n=1 Tax=Streptomyces sp. NPDC050400 TaxID=3365610 RepID=UPI003791BF0F